MADCSKCRYAIWDFEEYYPFVRHFVVSGCKLDNDEEDCEDLHEKLLEMIGEQEVEE